MFPIRDEHKTRTFPFINNFFILANIVVFVVEISSPNIEAFIFRYAFISRLFDLFNPLSYPSLFTSLFLHGGFLHIGSNLWFLHIFGDNVEDRLGHIRYFLFYLSAGVAATLAQYFLNPQSAIPLIGASGAISGVAGAYFVYFKHSRIEALVPTFFGFWDIIKLPVWFFLGYWFVIQVFSGIGSVSSLTDDIGGVAFFAHIGGFVFGYIIAHMLHVARDTYHDQ